MVNNKAVYDNVQTCLDLIYQTEELLNISLDDCENNSYLHDLTKMCIRNTASLIMKLQVASSITKPI